MLGGGEIPYITIEWVYKFLMVEPGRLKNGPVSEIIGRLRALLKRLASWRRDCVNDALQGRPRGRGTYST